MGDLRQPNVATAEEKPEFPPPSPLSNPSPFLIGAERWDRAEEATQKIICKVQPTSMSEKRRKEVIDYVQRLIRGCLGCEVFPFGSVPLKTYLPDGDIDLTAFGGANVEEALVNDVVSVLEAEDKNRAAEFVVKDVQLIRAEVKLVKCIVQNIVVDISFNQLGGLCTLCFLEQVDHLIGKDHLFKRSIILIKAWCYYESRILGAHHGLISTYALETLVLYIFHLFHSTLNGPLTVLYRFLDYFSKFDWDNYCVSLTGPVRISSLPEIVAEKPENGGSDLLLNDDFLRHCAGMFSVPSRGGDSNLRTFPSKHLNIIDPLKENNNLGRSVSKGNFYRIRSAFTYGAKKLGQILQQPKDDIADDLQNFFLNTLDRHGCEQRPDVQDPIPKFDRSGHFPALSASETVSLETETSDLISSNLVHINGTSNHLDSNGASYDGVKDLVVSRSEVLDGRTMNRHENGSSNEVDSSSLLLETVDSLNKTAIAGYHTSGDAKDLRLEGLTSDETPNGFHPSPNESIIPHSGLVAARLSSGGLQGCGVVDSMDSVASVSNQVSSLTEEGSRGYRESTSMDVSSSHHDNQKSLSNLDGDYESHLNSLRYGRWWFDNSSHLFFPPQFPSQFQGNSSWDVINHHNHYNRNGFSYNGPMPRPPFFHHMNPLVMPGAAAFSMEDVSKARGTGPYFPNTNRPSHHNKGFTGRGGRNQGAVRSHRDNGRAVMTATELNFHDRRSSNHELLQAQNLQNGMLQPHHHANGFVPPLEGVVEFGSVGHVPSGVSSLPDSITPLSPSQTSSHGGFPSSPGIRKSKPAQSMNQERVMEKSSYLLKDDEDFPPLSI